MPDRSSTAPFRGVLIGCGFFSRNHLHAWQELAGVEIVAVCDLDRTRAQAMADAFGIARVYDSTDALFAAEQYDFVDIATTVQSHRMLVEQACAHADVVICQKPFAETMADGEAMVAAAERHGTQLLVHENFRWQMPFVTAMDIVRSGAIGTPQFARFSFRHGYDNYANQPYLAQIERFTIMDVGLHLFDLARHFMGEVTRLSCTTQRLNPIVRGEDAFTTLFQHDNGGTSVCDCSFYSVVNPDPFPNTAAWIEGPLGTIIIDAAGRIVVHTKDGTRTIAAPADWPSWATAPFGVVQDSVRHFQAHALDVMAGRAAPQPSGADNLKTLKLALAAYVAADEGRTIDMGTVKLD